MRIVTNNRCWSAPAGISFSSTPDPLPWGEEAVYFASGREALVALIKAAALKRGARVMLPAFVPEGIIAPFRRAGCSIHLYGLDDNLEPEYVTVEGILQKCRPVIAVFIHYFGLQKDIKRFVEICHAHGTYVIEDLAQLLKLHGADIGTSGDYILHSLTKVLPLPDGAVLEFGSGITPSDFRFHRGARHLIYRYLRLTELALNTLQCRLTKNWAIRTWLAASPLLYRAVPSYRVLMSYFERPHGMSELSRRLLSNTSVPVVVRHRQKLEQIYDEGLSMQLFPRLPSMACPASRCMMGFPVRVSDRESLVTWLRRHYIRGVFFESKWDFIPNGPEFAASRRVMHHHFLFPTAAALGCEDIYRTIEVANAWPQ